MLSGEYKGAVLGDINIDMYGEFPALPQKGQGMNTDKLEIGLGGTGMNVTQMLRALKFQPYPLANLGSGYLSEIARSQIEELDIEQGGIERLSGKTGLFFCLITPDGDRTMLGYRGVNREPVDYSDRLQQLPSPPEWDFIFISAYLFLHKQQRRELLTWLEEIRSFLPKIKVGMVVSHLFAEKAGTGGIDIDQLDCCDFLFMNKAEFEQIAGKLSAANLKDLAEKIGLDNLAVTEGEKGCIIYSNELKEGGGKSREKKLDKNCRGQNSAGVEKIEGFTLDPVDTTGAGDCFAAGLLAAKISGLSPVRAALFANFCGAVAGLDYGISQPVKKFKRTIQGENYEDITISRSFLQNLLQKIAKN